jgi:hypothetical protein
MVKARENLGEKVALSATSWHLRCLMGLMGRVERWRGSEGEPCLLPTLSVAGARVTRLAPFPPLAHRTGQADLPQPALRRTSPPGTRALAPFTPSIRSFRSRRTVTGVSRPEGQSPGAGLLPQRARSQAPWRGGFGSLGPQRKRDSGKYFKSRLPHVGMSTNKVHMTFVTRHGIMPRREAAHCFCLAV